MKTKQTLTAALIVVAFATKAQAHCLKDATAAGLLETFSPLLPGKAIEPLSFT